MSQKSKKGSKSPKRKPAYIAPKPKKPVVWSPVETGLGILRYRPAVTEPSGSLAMSRVFMSTSASIVAPVFAAVEDFPDWTPALVDNIFQIANEVNRITLQQLKLRANSKFPIQCVCPTLFLNHHKVTILVRPSPTLKPFQGGVTSTLDDDQVRSLDMLMTDHHGVIIQCPGRTFSLWKDRNKFFGFIPNGLAGVGNFMPALLKSNDLRKILNQGLKMEHGPCNLYTLKVLSKEKVDTTLSNLNKEFEIPISPKPEEAFNENPSDIELETAETPPPADVPAKTKRDKKKPEEVVVVEPEPSDDVTLQFGSDYKEFPDKRGILTGKEYCTYPERILHTNIATALFLHHLPANLWTSAIIRDIIKLGKTLFYQSEDDNLLGNEDWMDRIKQPIKFMNKYFSLHFEKKVFGKVHSTESDVLSLEQGLMKFFEGNDIGLMLGPQMVLVWQQKNNYFMFDPKERDGLGRKWTKTLSAALGSTASSGSACITWYQNPKKMAEVYIDNVALKHRKDPYRIVKIKFIETPSKATDEGEWIGVSQNKWILIGTKSLCDFSYAEDTLRLGKSICMGIAALIRSIETAEEDWESETIDNVLSEGVELVKLSADPQVAGKSFTVMSVKKIVDIGGRRIRLSIVNCMIRGSMLAESTVHNSVPLEIGLTKFFEYTNYGIITVKDIALAIWRGQDKYFYLFYPYEKPFGVPPQCLCSNDLDLPPMGIANAMRFKTMTDLYSFLLLCLNTKETDEYCLNPVDIDLSDANDRPPLLEYEEFGESGAVLRPFKDLHEGHEIFGVRADKQTLANLLIALGFNRINSSTTWTKEDLADILHIGDKIFCKIFMRLPECQSRDYKLQWDEVVPVIGLNKFTFIRTPIKGVIELLPEIFGEEGEQETPDQEYDDNEEGIEAQDDEFVVAPREGLPIVELSRNDLNGTLKAWDAKNSEHYEAVLETDFYKVAIWKRDNLYFVFDPKASGENGELTERRIEIGKDYAADDSRPKEIEEPTFEADELIEEKKEKPAEAPILIEKRIYTEFDNDGTAYAAWFLNFDEFYNHIVMKIPDDYKNGKFTLHDLLLTNTPLGTEDLESNLKPGFRSITPNHLLLRGSITQNNPSLKNRNKQEYTDCLVSLAFAKITPSNKITATLLDVVLKYGDRLYTKSLNALKKADKKRFTETLQIKSLDDILKVFKIYKIKFNWKITGTVNGNFSVSEMRKGTGRLGFIEAGTAVLLKHKGYLMSLWKSRDGFYLYDPFETDPNGWMTEGGLPSLSKFPKLDNMLNYLAEKYICLGGSNSFTMYLISIQSSTVEDFNFASTEPEDDKEKIRVISNIPKDQQVFQVYQDDMRILKSPFTCAKVPQHCLALAALVHSRLQYVELWNYNISQRISFLSKYLFHKSECNIEDHTTSISFDDIRCSFTIDNNILCHVVLTKNMQGPIHSVKRTETVGINLKNALTIFFKSCHQGLVTMPGVGRAFALWKDAGSFYLFGVDRTKAEMFVIASPTLFSLYDTLLEGTDSVGDANNWYEVRSVNVSTVPIQETVCKPILLDKKPSKNELSVFAAKDDDSYAVSKEAYYYDYVSTKPQNSLSIKQRKSPKEFVEIADGVEVLYSHCFLPSHRFYGTSDLFPSLQAACVECAALSRIKSPSLWTKKILAKILLGGTNLYINAVAVSGTSNLQIVDFCGNIFISNNKVEVCPLPPKVQGAIKDDLLLSLSWILKNYQTAYLHTANFCFALVLDNNDFYLYYPGSYEPLCEDFQNEYSCLIRFCSISDLLDKILNNGKISLCENIFIGPIDVCIKQ